MSNRIKNKTLERKTKLSPEEIWRAWESVRGIFKNKGPKDPVKWQRRIRKEPER